MVCSGKILKISCARQWQHIGLKKVLDNEKIVCYHKEPGNVPYSNEEPHMGI